MDAYDDPTAARDLRFYDEEFELPPCTIRNHCFRKVNQEGKRRPLPEPNPGWAQEISIDLEVAHSICQNNCNILLVEARSEKPGDLEAAEDRAAAMGATEISNSWSEPETLPAADSPAFNHPGIVITAAAGDAGYLNWAAPPEERGLVNYPASSPHVVAVGGTRLTMNASSGLWSETVWNGKGTEAPRGATGGGCSTRFAAPFWQQELADWAAVGCGSQRAVADIAADSDPYPGVAIYDSTPNQLGSVGWESMGGTSVSTPLIAATFALAGGAGGVEYPARTLYENELRAPASLHDVESGASGECSKPPNPEGLSGCTTLEEEAACSSRAICVAGPGYDGPSGVGTPSGIGAFQPTGAPLKKAQLIEFTSAPPAAARVRGPTYTVSATASSGLAVSFVSGTPSVCTLEGAAVTFVAAGECTVEADQAGNAEYRTAPQARQSFAVGKGAQIITFTSAPPLAAGVGGASYAVAAMASSGLAVSLSSGTPSVCSLAASTVTFVGAGGCTIDANQPGNADYEAAPEARQSFAVSATATPEPILPPSLGTLSFRTSASPALTPAADSNFSLVGRPAVNRHTGAVTFTASFADPGTLSWLLTFPNGMFGVVQAAKATCGKGRIRLQGKCRPAAIVFANGSTSVTAAGNVTFVVTPSRLGTKALDAALEHGRGLSVAATLTFQSGRGGAPVSHARSLTLRIVSSRKKR